MKEKINNNESLDNYFKTKETSYFVLLKSSEKYVELYKETEGIVSLWGSVLITCLICFVVYNMNSIDNITSLLSDLLINLSMALIGLLGVLISGIAIFTGTMTNKLVRKIESDNKSRQIVNILYSFYFISGIVGLTVVMFIIMYILVRSDFIFSFGALVIFSIICSYLFLFSVLYTVALCGTCIRLFLVSYRYSDSRFWNENKANKYWAIHLVDGETVYIDDTKNEYFSFKLWIDEKQKDVFKFEENNKLIIIRREAIVSVENEIV